MYHLNKVRLIEANLLHNVWTATLPSADEANTKWSKAPEKLLNELCGEIFILTTVSNVKSPNLCRPLAV